MRLTVHTDYALRMLTHLGVLEGRTATIEEVAAAYGISRNHLMKIANLLQHHGVRNATRGKGGGLQLAKPANTLRLGDLVQTLEPDMALAECLGDNNQCVVTSQCLLIGVLSDALGEFLRTLNQYTLEDICVPKQKELRGLLRIDLTQHLQ